MLDNAYSKFKQELKILMLVKKGRKSIFINLLIKFETNKQKVIKKFLKQQKNLKSLYKFCFNFVLKHLHCKIQQLSLLIFNMTKSLH